jgi:general secretion pathway protein C
MATFLLAALAAASTVYWSLRWPAPAATLPFAILSEDPVQQDSQALARLLGQVAAGGSTAVSFPGASSRYVLTGVIAGPGPGGAALISIDGKPAKPFPVGRLVDDNQFVQSVSGRRAVLAAGAANAMPALTLEMKPLTR